MKFLIGKEKLKQLNFQHSHSISILHSQIDESQQEIERLNKQLTELADKNSELNAKLSPLSLNVSTASSKPIEFANNFILRQAEVDHVEENKVTNRTLEELLNEPPPNPQSLNSNNDNVVSLLQQMELLRNDLHKGKLQLIHLNELLNESELTNSRLTEQITVLKEEIRRCYSYYYF